MKESRFGKYRNIILSVALFLLLDAGVLFVNFFMSFQISADAVAVNLAGRQRMLSQRITKSLLDIEFTQANGSSTAPAFEELTNSTLLFHNTFNAFKDGGMTKDANGFDKLISQVDQGDASNAIIAAEKIWTPLHERLNVLINTSGNPDNPLLKIRLDEAIRFGRENNVALLALMNDLTVALENKASAKASRLRLIQTVGISLAILNFFLIMFHFVRQLRESDEKIEQARQETQEILETVGEGLFLLDQDLIIGNQYSNELTHIFNRDDIAQTSFQDLLTEMISAKDMSTAESFIKLLFKPTINEKLIGELNPLNEIEIHISDANGQYQSKYLNFQFSRVKTNGEITHVLSTVSDITEQIELTKELDSARQQNEQQIEMISTLMHSNTELLPMFLTNAFNSVEKINNILRTPSKTSDQHKSKIQKIFALIHEVKGEATSLGLTPFADISHRFEDQLAQLNEKENLSGNDFLSLTVLLNQTYHQLEASRNFITRLGSLANHMGTETTPSFIEWTHLQTMADEISQRHDKSVDIVHSGLNDQPLNEHFTQTINSIFSQFIRNSISHGIETVEDRLALQKPTTAEIQIHVSQLRNGSYRVSFKDDGAGLDLDKIRNTAISRGIITEQKAELMDKKQLISLIFKPEFSTSAQADQDSGRGMGMSVINNLISELGGKLTVASEKNKGCRFTMLFPAEANAITAAA